MRVRKLTIQIVIIYLLCWPAAVWAQDPLPTNTPAAEELPEAPAQVDVQPVAQDNQIDERLTGILQATEWFVAPRVAVRDGVVFLDGQTYREEYREWAGNLARNTQDVVAVVNRVEVIPRSAWDFSPALAEIRALWRGAIQAIPVFIFGAVVLCLTWWLTRGITRLSDRMLRNRLDSPLLTTITARAIAFPVFMLGLYLVLQVAGLTPLALTLLGGTGIMGIVIGFAFRDIAENFLASLLLSMRRPFHSKDFIEVAGYSGIVQQMNTRSTVLMTLEGNHVQIPNATVFKNTIVNYTANPNRRTGFGVGIGYDDDILQAQELIAQLLNDHPAVLKSPEPLVLVEELGVSTVNLRIYFWYDGTKYAPDKVKSSLVRLTKRAFKEAGISMPDQSREVIFPQGVPIVQVQQPQAAPLPKRPEQIESFSQRPTGDGSATEPVTTATEGNLRSEGQDIQEQADQSRALEEGQNLLENE